MNPKAPGTYRGSVDFGSKVVNLVSHHYLRRDRDLFSKTIIDGQAGDFAICVRKREAIGTPLIHGFTIRNADDGVTATGTLDLEHCHVTETSDGIDDEEGGGSVRFCRFEDNRDDAIDLDGSTAVLIEQCELVNNEDDGIEIRLQPHPSRTPLGIVVRDNLIAGNGEDGIQLIGYDVETTRSFRFEGNRISGNAMAGIGLMSGANTREDYEAAPLPEPMLVNSCTFSGNEYGRDRPRTPKSACLVHERQGPPKLGRWPLVLLDASAVGQRIPGCSGCQREMIVR